MLPRILGAMLAGALLLTVNVPAGASAFADADATDIETAILSSFLEYPEPGLALAGSAGYYSALDRIAKLQYSQDAEAELGVAEPDQAGETAPDSAELAQIVRAKLKQEHIIAVQSQPAKPVNRFADFTTVPATPSAARFFNTIFPWAFGEAKSNGPEWLTRTELRLSLDGTLKPLYSLNTIQPLWTNQPTDLLFWQSRVSADSTGTTPTLNVGAGYRKLLDGQSRLLGVNGFYDYSYDTDRSRAGVGLEFFAGQLETRLNGYFVLNGGLRRLPGDSSGQGNVAAGYDLKIGGPLPEMPWLTLYASKQVYFHERSADVATLQFRTGLRLTPHFSVKLGYAVNPVVESVLFNYTFGPSSLPSLKTYQQQQENAAMGAKLLQSVQRDNTIHIEK